MNLDQLIDPQRLARIWAKKAAETPAREPEPRTQTRADTTRADTTRADTTRADTILDPRALTEPMASPDVAAGAERAETQALTRPVIPLFEDAPPRPVFKLRPGAPEAATPAPAAPRAASTDAGADTRAPEPASAERALDALESEVLALFGPESQDHTLVLELLGPMRETLASDGVAALKAEDIDDLEDLLDARCSANYWPMGTRSGEDA